MSSGVSPFPEIPLPLTTINPFSRPLYVMLKPAGALCNMRCDYCYYTEKSKLYTEKGNHVLSDSLLERFVRQYIEAQTGPEVNFTWHGGEPLMRPISFYRRALSLQRAYGAGRRIVNCIQTNGTLLTDDWCRFLRENNFLVGLSVDGPREFHDEYRRTVAGGPTFRKVMHAVELLNRYGVEWNAMAVVNEYNADYPLEFYRFFRDAGCRYLQFTPVVERIVKRGDGLTLAPGMQEEGKLAPFSVSAEQWGAFLIAVFDEWVRRDVGTMFVQLFDATLALWAGFPPGICTLARDCGHAAVMEYNGDVYSCDHFVFPEYRLGNIRSKTITEMIYSEQQRQFAAMKRGSLPRQCRECEFLFACHGECPRNRFLRDRYGEPGLNYLCSGYLSYFRHVAPYMDYMKHELSAQRPASGVMDAIRRGELPALSQSDL